MENKQGKHTIVIPFCGFYESAASQMIDDEVERAFDYDDSQNSHIPDTIYFSREYGIDYSAIHEKLCIAYLEGFQDRYEGETDIALGLEFETLVSPKYYNFETDRLFAFIPVKTINALFTESEKDNHVQLTARIKEKFTSYDGFWSSYPNDLGAWLLNPILTWDHNELGTLLESVFLIHVSEKDHDRKMDTWDLLESWTCNGGLSNAVWDAMPAKTQSFANLQRNYGQAVDFDLWLETGKAYADGTPDDCIDDDHKLPEPRCDKTSDMKGI